MKRLHSPFLWLAVAFLLFKFWQHRLSLAELQFLLYPIKIAIELVTGAKAQYQPNEGYVFSDLHCVIGESCSGLNFLFISWCTLSSLVLLYYPSQKNRGLTLLSTVSVSYLLTLFANTARILGAIIILRLSVLFPWFRATWLHQAEGILVYFSMLFLSCIAFFYWIQKNTQKNEKPA
jgi:exosortase K